MNMDLASSNVYQTTYRKEEGKTIVYIALASLLALAILFGAVYFMFFNTGENQAKQMLDSQKNIEGTISNNEDMMANSQPTPSSSVTPTVKSTTTPTPTSTSEQNNNQQEEQNSQTFDTNYVYGKQEQGDYSISEDKSQILQGDNPIYTAPQDYKIVSFAINGNAIFIVFKTPDAYTYEFRKVYKGSNNLGGLFYKYYSAYDMTSFVVDPVNYKTKPTYIIFTSRSKKQIFVLKVENFKETGRKVESAPGYYNFVSAFKLADQDSILINYKTADNNTAHISITFSNEQ